MPPYKTIVISCLARKHGRTVEGDYTDVDLVYNVEPTVSIDDFEYALRRLHIDLAPVKINTGEGNTKLPYCISVDSGRSHEAQNKNVVLNRLGAMKRFEKDLKGLDWTPPLSKRKIR